MAISSVVVAVVARYGLDVTVARLAGAAQFGAYAVLVAYSLTLASVATFGLPVLANQEVPVLKTGDQADLRAFVRLGNLTSVLLGAALGAVVGVIVEWLALVPGGGAPTVLAALVPAVALFTWRRQLALLTEPRTLALFSPVVISVAATVMVIILSLAGCSAIGPLAALTVAYLGVVRLLVQRGSAWRSSPAPGRPLWRRGWARRSSVIFLSNFATIVTLQLDVLLVAQYANPAEVGAYASASRVSLIVTLALAGLTVREGPRFGILIAAGRDQECWTHYKRACAVSLAVGMLMAAVLVGFGSTVLGAFGAEFRVATPWLAVLVIGRLVSAATGPAAELLVTMGRQRDAAGASWAGLVVTLSGILVLGALLGPLGLAVGTAFGTSVQNLAQMVLAHRAMRARLSPPGPFPSHV